MTTTTLNRNGGIDSWIRSCTDRLCQGDYVALVINHAESYVFDTERAQTFSGKPWIIFEYGEYGTNHSWQNDYFPAVTIQSHRPLGCVAEYLKLDEFLKTQKIALCFKREYSQKAQELVASGRVHYPVAPIEIFFDNLPPVPPLDREEYMNRVGLIWHLFGNSHPDRKRLAGAMMERFERICTSIPKQADLVNHKLPFHHVEQVEHLSRYAMHEVLHHQGKCLLSVNLAGFGVKSFRLREAYHNCVPIMADIGMKYAIQPNDDNAVMLPTKDGRILLEESIAKLESVLRDRENLWHRMQNAHTVAEMLCPDRYVREQVNAKIQEVL